MSFGVLVLVGLPDATPEVIEELERLRQARQFQLTCVLGWPQRALPEHLSQPIEDVDQIFLLPVDAVNARETVLILLRHWPRSFRFAVSEAFTVKAPYPWGGEVKAVIAQRQPCLSLAA
jgi:hypothetical protein